MAGTGAMGGLAHFLSAQKDAFLADVDSGRAQGWVVAMGNEAGGESVRRWNIADLTLADLDSLASSIAYSVLSSALLETKAIPLLLTPHDLMDLRPENLLVLDQTQIPLSNLLHLDTLPASLMPDASAAVRSPGVGLTNAKVEYALVDHNRLMPEFGPGKVVAVIDHHEDEHAHDDAPVKYVQVPTGSCASLVTKHFMRQWQAAIPAQGGAAPVPPELATLLLAAILIDTNGLKKGGKAVSTDYEAAHFLFPLSAYSRPSSSTSTGDDVAVALEVSEDSVPEALSDAAKELKAKKFDVSKLSTTQLLMRDYKDYSLPTSSQVFPSIQAGLATVPLALKEWLARDVVGGGGQTGWAGFLAESDAYMAKRGLDVLGVLTSFKSDKGKDKREAVLLVRYGLDGCAFADEETGQRVMDQLVAGFEADQVLLLENWKDKSQPAGAKRISRGALDSQHRFGVVWKQGNAEATRKQFAPVLVSHAAERRMMLISPKRHLVSALS